MKGLHDQIYSIDITESMTGKEIMDVVFQKFNVEDKEKMHYALFAKNATKGGGNNINNNS